MDNKQRLSLSLLIAFSVLFLSGCITYPQLVTSQYVDRPVIIGPYWKVGSKLENYAELKKQKELREFETEVERVFTQTTSQHGNYQTTTTQENSIHTDNISKDILMLNPTDDELVLIKRCYVGAYFMAAPGGAIKKTFGGVEGIIAPKPAK